MPKSRFEWHGNPLEIEAHPEGAEWKVSLPDGSQHRVRVDRSSSEGTLIVHTPNKAWRVAYHATPTEVQILYQGRFYRFQRPQPAGSPHHHASAEGVLTAPMPGLITKVFVQVGDRVEARQRLLVLEAMKMEQALYAPFEGIVQQLNAKEGEIVQEGTILVEIVEPT